jgi:hypothetical protein
LILKIIRFNFYLKKFLADFFFKLKKKKMGQPQERTDTSINSSHKEIFKQLDICQEKLCEEHERKGQEKLSTSSPHSKQLFQKGAQQLQQTQREIENTSYVKLVSPNTLKW